MKYTVGSER